MTEPLVSIIIPVFNGKEFIALTIESCIKQSHTKLEILILDDASRDNSIECIIARFKKDNRIKIFKNKDNLGFIKNVNKGISLSHGDYLLVLGQDDLLPKDHIQKALNEFDDETSFVFYGSKIIDETGEEIGEIKCFEDGELIDLHKLSRNNPVNSCGLLMSRKKLVTSGSYFECSRYPNYGEWNLWIRLTNSGKVKFSNSSVTFYRRHTNNMTKSFLQPDKYKKLRKYKSECMWLAYKLGDFDLRKKISFLINYVYFKYASYLKLIVLHIRN